MATTSTTYKVCVDGVLTSITIECDDPAGWVSRSYTQGGCDIIEQTKTLTFTLSQPADNSFWIYYQYWTYTKTNFNCDDPGCNQIRHEASVYCPAGQTVVQKDVFYYVKQTCDDDSDPYAPAQPEGDYAV